MVELTPSGADATIVTSQGPDGIELTLTGARAPGRVVVRLRSAEAIRAGCMKLGAVIHDVADNFRGPDPLPIGETAKQLSRLAMAGRTFLAASALRDPRNDLHLVSNLLTRACADPFRNRTEPPLIHVVARPDHYLPWEMLPLLDITADIEVRDQIALADSCRAFVGFSAVVERRDPSHEENAEYLNVGDQLRVRMMCDHRYPGAQSEAGFFRSRREFLLEGPFPVDAVDPSAPSLAEQLCDPRLDVRGVPREDGDHVVHFACHCHAPSDPGTGSGGFQLADDQRRPLDIELDALWEELARLWQAAAASNPAGSSRARYRPLVFLNACGTASMDPMGAASLLGPFHANGNTPIIGTAANIPDGTAAYMSKAFYTSILRGESVGSALHRAKWQLLEVRGDPLGMLYSVHAFAGLRIIPILMDV